MSRRSFAAALRGAFGVDTQRLHQQRFAWLSSRISNASFLDIGGLDGVLVSEAAARGSRVVAWEWEEWAVEETKSRLLESGPGVFECVDFIDQISDGPNPSLAIIETLDRLPDPSADLAQVVGQLPSDGVLVIACSLPVRMDRVPWLTGEVLRAIITTPYALTSDSTRLITSNDGAGFWLSQWRRAEKESDEF